MCGRYTLTTPAGMGLPDRFGVPDDPEEATLERYNVCPTEQIAVVSRKEGERKMRSVRWGLVPSWAKELGKGREPINARSETVAETKTVRRAVRARRPALPGPRRRLVRVAALREPQAAADPVPLHGRRRRAVRVRRAVRLREARRGLDHVRDDPHHRAPTASARRCTTACRSCSPAPTRRPRGWRAPTIPSCSLPLADARTVARPANPAVNRAGVEGPELIEPPSRAGARSAAAAL